MERSIPWWFRDAFQFDSMDFPPIGTQPMPPTAFERFVGSGAYRLIVEFLADLAASVRGREIGEDEERQASEKVRLLKQELETMGSWVEFIPPLKESMRFGNRAFKTWHEHLAEKAGGIIARLSSGDAPRFQKARSELQAYMLAAFGSPQRLDYGTGHEVAFLVFLLGLCRVGVFTPDDRPALVLVVFKAYIDLMRRLEEVYRLEPAGSRGVWGLDDFHFLPFLFGAAQLEGGDMTPSQLADPFAVDMIAHQNFYADALKQIRETKVHVPLGECNPVLNDLFAVPNWRKMKTGLLKMFEGEVLTKRPAVQHLPIGVLLNTPFLERKVEVDGSS